MAVDLTAPLENDAILVIDPYPLTQSGNFELRKGEIPLHFAERWLSRELSADVKLQYHPYGNRFWVKVNGAVQKDAVEVKVHMKRKRRASVTKEVEMSKPRKAIADLIEELRSWLPNYDHGPNDYPTTLYRILAGLPGGDQLEDMGYEPLGGLGWQEADQLGRVLEAIQDKRDVEDLVAGLTQEEGEGEVEEARPRFSRFRGPGGSFGHMGRYGGPPPRLKRPAPSRKPAPSKRRPPPRKR
jgi:hypothetical protein